MSGTEAAQRAPVAVGADGGAVVEELATARAIIAWAMPFVFRLYECRADALFETHAVAEAARRAARDAGTGVPPGLVLDRMSSSSSSKVSGPAEGHRLCAEVGGGGWSPPSGADPLQDLSSFVGNVQTVLVDPPYTTRRKAKRQRSGHDVLTEEDARRFVESCRVMVRPGGVVLICCAWEQVPMWVGMLRDSVDHVVVNGKRKDTTLLSNTSPQAFEVNSHPVYALRAVHGRVSMGRTSTLSSNMSEVIIAAKRSGATGAASHVMVNYRSFGCVPSRFRPFDNVIDNVPDVLQNEAIMAVDKDGKEYKVRAEQKSVALMMELIQRYSQPGDIVVDTFCGTCTTGDAGMSIPGGQYRRVILCDAFADALDGGGRQRLQRVFVEPASLGGFARLLGDAGDQVRAAAEVVLAAERRDGSLCSVRTAKGGVSRPARSTPRAGVNSSVTARFKRLCAPPDGLPAHSAVPRSVLLLLASITARETDGLRHALGGGPHPRAPPPGRVVASELLDLAGQPLEAWPDRLRVAFCTADPVVLRDLPCRGRSGVAVGLWWRL